MKTIILDFGNSLWKARTANGLEIVVPHAIKPISNADYDKILRNYGGKDIPLSYVKINGQAYVIGEHAERHSGYVASKTGAARYTADYMGVGTAAIAARLYAQSASLSIFASHPPGDVIYTDDLANALLGVWDVECGGKRRTYEIDTVNTFDEPAGGLMNVLLSADGSHYQNPELKSGRTLVIDIGGYTTDFIVIENGEIDYGIAQSLPLGILQVTDNFQSAFIQRYSHLVKNTNGLKGDRVREAILTGQYRGGGKILDCADEAAAARNLLVSQVLQTVQSRMGGGFSYDAILHTGGGSALLMEHIAPHLENSSQQAADNLNELHLANVRGGAKLHKLYALLGEI